MLLNYILVEHAVEGGTLAPVVVASVDLLVGHVHVHSRARLGVLCENL